MAFGIVNCLRVCGIYRIRNTINGKFYVGSSVNVEGRIFKHLSFLRRGIHPNAHLQAAFTLYGESAFAYELIEECGKDQLLACEQSHIDSLRPAYNICQVAGNTLGYQHTEEAKAKMSAFNKGNTRNLGNKHSEQTRRRLSEMASQRRVSPETRAKIARAVTGNKSNTGRKLPEDHVAKIANASLKMWNGADADQRRQAAADRARARWSNPEWKAQQSAKIKAGKAERLASDGNHFGIRNHQAA